MSKRIFILWKKKAPPPPIDDSKEHIRKCIEELKQTSAYDILTRSIKFRNDIEDLINKYHLPHIIAVGVLVDTVVDHCTQEQQIKTKDAFLSLSHYIDDHCMKKEPSEDDHV